LTLDAGQSTTETFTTGTSSGDAGSYTATVSSEDDSGQDSFEVLEGAYFAVSGVNAEDIVEGDDLQVNATIENTGNSEVAQQVDMNSGLGSDNELVELSGGESTTVTFTTGTSSGDAGSYTATVSSEDDSGQDEFVVSEPGGFIVDITQPGDGAEIGEGETVTVEYTVENTGDTQDTQTIEFTVDRDLQDSEEVDLGPGDQHQGEFTWQPGGQGDYTLRVAGEEDHDEVTVTVVGDGVEYELSIDVDGGGTVEVDGQTVGIPYTESYYEGTRVNITAVPDQGWWFDEWTGDLVSEQESIEIEMDGDKSLTAHFVESDPGAGHELSIDVEGEGVVLVNGAEVDIPYSRNYEEGAEVELTADPAENWTFSHWEGTEETGEGITIVMDENKSLTAYFQSVGEGQHELVINVDGEGNTTPDEGTYTYNEAERVQLSAHPAEGWTFMGWTGDVPAGEGDNREVTLLIDKDRSVTAHFLQEALFVGEIVSHDEEVEVGEEAVVEYRLTNTGGLEGTREVKFTVYDEEDNVVFEDSENITLGVNEVHEDEFVWETEEPGEYTVVLMEGSETITVEEKSEASSTFYDAWCGFWWLILIVIILFAVILAVLFWKRNKEEESYPTSSSSPFSQTSDSQPVKKKQTDEAGGESFFETMQKVEEEEATDEDVQRDKTSTFVSSESHQVERGEQGRSKGETREEREEMEGDEQFVESEKQEDTVGPEQKDEKGVFLETEEESSEEDMVEKEDGTKGEAETEQIYGEAKEDTDQEVSAEREEGSIVKEVEEEPAPPAPGQEASPKEPVEQEEEPSLDEEQTEEAGGGGAAAASGISEETPSEQECPVCGKSVEEGKAQCPYCRADLEEPPSSVDDEMFYECDECGFLITEDVDECPYCEAPIDKDKDEE
ncbi:MAG: CARDB domain-containing protein, partial [Candidatus Thermoplasmatota archaeon]